MRKSRGFTLVELLVVIVIMGVLTSVVVGVVPAATARARDAAFGATLAVTQSACDLFYVESNEYPVEAQPESGLKAGALSMGATDAHGAAFLGGYLQFPPNSDAVAVGLKASDGEVVYYGVTALGRVFATQEEPLDGAWTGGVDVKVYTQDDLSGDLMLEGIL